MRRMHEPEDRKLRVWLWWLLALLLAGLGSSCAGGGGGGISGTGFTSDTTVTAKVTGFGSVVVGGVHYTAASGASVQVEGITSAAEADLQPGMVVVLKGTFDSSTKTGTYRSISYRSEVTGPAAGISVLGGTLTVLGQSVLVDPSTLFDGVADLSLLPAGALVQVSGDFDGLGRLHASRLLLVKNVTGATDPVKLKGRVSASGVGTFNIGSQQVSFNGQTVFAGLTAADLGTADTRVVEVTGTFDGTTFSASRIERIDPLAGAAAGERMEVRGFITSGNSASFVLSSPNGPVTVTAGSAVIANGSPAALVTGQQVEVTGTLSGGILSASRIELEQERTVKIEGNLTAIDLVGGRVTVNGIVIQIADQTVFKDASAAGVRGLSLNGLALGDHLQVGGFLDPSVTPAVVVATSLERTDTDPSGTSIVQGPVSQKVPQFVILGIPVVTGGGTTFERNGAVLDSATFTAEVTLNSTIVKAKGTFSAGPPQLSATEMELVQP